jgi:hypothetical protein
MQVGDIVTLTSEGKTYIYEYTRGIDSIGLIVKKYKYEDGDEISNGQYVYDVLISGQVVKSLFNEEIMLTK